MLSVAKRFLTVVFGRKSLSLFLGTLFLFCAVFCCAAEEAALPLAGVKIGIDPGHQRIYDPKAERIGPNSTKVKQKVAGGCVGVVSRVMEYEVNLQVALLLADMLTKAGAEVFLTHDTLDVNISNRQRAEFFNAHEVDLGIRLHCNKAGSASERGAITLVPGKDCTGHFIANLFAGITVQESYCAVTGLPSHLNPGMLEFRDDQSGFNWCTRPVFCLEMGYLSNAEDDALLSDPAFWPVMAQGIFEGICNCFGADGKLKVS